ncbi:MAG: WXG100 family type VII secretion target, partial [Acidimicrobiales bacterium]
MALPEEHGAGAQGEEPPPPPPPPPIATSFDLWDFFGDPAQLRAAATAWEAIATHLEGIERRLGATVRASGAEWSGKAHDAFREHWDAMGPELGTGADGMREVAAQLRGMADELQAKNDLIQSIYVMIAATAAVSVVSGLVTFGVGAAVGAASVAANVMKAERVLAAVKAFVVASRVAMAAVKATKIGAFSLRFAGFAAQGTIATAAVKQVALDQDPFDAKNWSATDGAG